jgi:hypothetical protein
MLSEYRAHCSNRVRSVKVKSLGTKAVVNVPSYHKAMESKCTPMLFGSHATMTVNYCVPPWVVKMSFYHQVQHSIYLFINT